MAIFNFGGIKIDTEDPTANIEQALNAAGVEIHGSIVMGDSHGVTGGTHTGDVYPGDKRG